MSCRGSGMVEGVKEIKVTIPAGWSQTLFFEEFTKDVADMAWGCAKEIHTSNSSK